MSLESELNAFSKLFKAHINASVKAEIRWVTVKAVDWDKKTMTAADADGLEYLNVMLGLKTNFVKPKVGSFCLIAIVEGQETVSVLIHADDSEEVWIDGDKIVMNGGENEGLVIAKELTSKINILEARCNNMLTILKSISITLAPSGTFSLASFFSSLSPLQQTNKSDIQNEKVKH